MEKERSIQDVANLLFLLVLFSCSAHRQGDNELRCAVYTRRVCFNFLVSAENNWQNWITSETVIENIKGWLFLGHSVVILM